MKHHIKDHSLYGIDIIDELVEDYMCDGDIECSSCARIRVAITKRPVVEKVATVVEAESNSGNRIHNQMQADVVTQNLRCKVLTTLGAGRVAFVPIVKVFWFNHSCHSPYQPPVFLWQSPKVRPLPYRGFMQSLPHQLAGIKFRADFRFSINNR
ncbi:hypothetical protein CR513_45674, partial [Mucuna pruriens]